MDTEPRDGFDFAAPTPNQPGGWEAEQERLALQRDIQRARTTRVRWVVGGLVALLLTLGWFYRWEIQPVHGGTDSGGFAYALDRITGRLYWLRRDEQIPVEPGK